MPGESEREARRRPPGVLRERLAAARRAGISFDEAWPVALASAVNTVQWEREEWQDVLASMVETWRAGWERRESTGAERAVLEIVMPGGTPLPERACENCGEEIAADRHRNARYCSNDCAKRAAYLRERQRAAA
jgi:predicted nucleic acid-binding Zn ribbon protein